MHLYDLKKELSYEVDGLHAEKHESLLQIDSIIFDGFGQACPISWLNLQYLCDILRKKPEMELGT